MPHILIVDDEPQVGFFLHQALESVRPDYIVSTAQTGTEALQLAQHEPMDLAIIDYRLKDMDGLVLVATLRQQGQVPLVIMTTAGPLPVIEKQASAEVLHWIQKPFSIVQLMSAIGEILDETISSSDPESGGASGGDPQLQDPNATLGSGNGEASGRSSHSRGPNTTACCPPG